MARDIVVLAIGGVFGLGAAIAGAAAPVYLPPSALPWLFWGGITLFLTTMLDAFLIFGWHGSAGQISLIDLGLFAISAGLIWHYSSNASGVPAARPAVATGTQPLFEARDHSRVAVGRAQILGEPPPPVARAENHSDVTFGDFTSDNRPPPPPGELANLSSAALRERAGEISDRLRSAAEKLPSEAVPGDLSDDARIMYFELQKRNGYPDRVSMTADMRSGMTILRMQTYRKSKDTKDAADFLKWFADQLKAD